MFKNSAIPKPYSVTDSESGNIVLPITDAAVELPFLKGSAYAIIQIQDNNVRYWLNGATPTAAVGFIANVGDKITLELGELKQSIKFCNATGGSNAKIAVQYYNA